METTIKSKPDAAKVFQLLIWAMVYSMALFVCFKIFRLEGAPFKTFEDFEKSFMVWGWLTISTTVVSLFAMTTFNDTPPFDRKFYEKYRVAIIPNLVLALYRLFKIVQPTIQQFLLNL